MHERKRERERWQERERGGPTICPNNVPPAHDSANRQHNRKFVGIIIVVVGRKIREASSHVERPCSADFQTAMPRQRRNKNEKIDRARAKIIRSFRKIDPSASHLCAAVHSISNDFNSPRGLARAFPSALKIFFLFHRPLCMLR